MPDIESPTEGPLSHLRVVDLTTARSGPTCVRQLADLGAQVIQVTMPGRKNLVGSDGYNLHRNKRSVTIDLKHADGLATFLRLTDAADVFVENMRPAVKHRLGIGPDVLRAGNPGLIYASLSGFGQDGPYADRPSVDQIAQGMSGIMSVTGPPGTGPWRVGIALSDTAAGTMLAQGVLAALVWRERTGQGQWLHTSLLESAINFMDFQACRWLTDGIVPPQAGNAHPTFFPMGTYRAADGLLNIAALKSLASFLAIIGAPELLDDELFATTDARRTNRNAFDAACEARLTTQPVAVWVERFNAAGIPAGPVYRVDETFADPQVQHLAITAQVAVPGGDTATVLRYPVTLERTPATVRSGPPAPGTHTLEVLRELGYDDDAIDRLVRDGAVSTDATPGTNWLA